MANLETDNRNCNMRMKQEREENITEDCVEISETQSRNNWNPEEIFIDVTHIDENENSATSIDNQCYRKVHHLPNTLNIFNIILPSIELRMLHDMDNTPNTHYINIHYYIMMHITPHQWQHYKNTHALAHRTINNLWNYPL